MRLHGERVRLQTTCAKQSRLLVTNRLALARQRCLLFGLEPGDPVGPRLEGRAGRARGRAADTCAQQYRFHLTKALCQWDLAGADVIAAAAFDAIHQAVGFQSREVPSLNVPVKLLWQEYCRANFRAVAAAYAGQLRGSWLQVERRRGDEAVRCLAERELLVRRYPP